MKQKGNLVYINETDALWQYIIDHAQPHEDGGYVARLRIKSRKGFERSIKARQRGLYEKTEEQVLKRTPFKEHPKFWDKLTYFIKSL
jgi:hypothetical protein